MIGLLASYPMFLWLLPLAAAPVIFHFFHRTRKRPRPFSSLMFFIRIDPRLHARKRIRELIALILRILTILLLLLALARPVLSAIGGGGAIACIVLIDNSASMSAVGREGKPKLNQALDAATAIISDLPAGSKAGIVLLVDDPAAAIPPDLTSQHEDILRSIGRVNFTHAHGSPGRALSHVLSLLSLPGVSRREIHVLTDLQVSEWDKSSLSTKQSPPGLAIMFHRIASADAQPGNAAIAQASLPQRRLIAGRPFLASVQIRNQSGDQAGVLVSLMTDENQEESERIQLAPGESRSVPLLLTPQAEGGHWARVSIEDNSFAADNHAYLGFTCSAKENVLLLGRLEDFGVLPSALSPTGKGDLSGLTLLPSSATALVHDLQSPVPAMVATTWSELAALGATSPSAVALEAYLRAGGVLYIAPRTSQTATPSTPHKWIKTAPMKLKKSSTGMAMIVFDKDAPIWSELKNDTGDILIQRMKAYRYFPVLCRQGATPLLGLASGQALFASEKLGEGIIYSTGLAPDAEWSSLPLRAAFLALVQSIALSGSDPSQHPLSLVSGDRLEQAFGAGRSARMTTVEGGPCEWAGKANAVPDFARAGIFRVTVGDSTRTVAVSSSPDEGRFSFVEGDRVPVLDGALPYSLDAYRSQTQLQQRVQRVRSGLDLFLPLYLFALAAMLAEGWVVNPQAKLAGPKRAFPLFLSRLRGKESTTAKVEGRR